MDAFRQLGFFVNNSHKRKTTLKSKISLKEVDQLFGNLKEHEEEIYCILTEGNACQPCVIPDGCLEWTH